MNLPALLLSIALTGVAQDPAPAPEPAAEAPAVVEAPDPKATVAEPPPYDDFLVIPLRVHRLRSDDLPEAHCDLSDADFERIVGKVNGIWNRAGVHFGLESIVTEPAANVEKFRASAAVAPDGKAPLDLFRVLLPHADHRDFEGLHVYYLHAFPVNGVYMGGNFAIVQETAKLRPVEGGIDEPLPRVTAHELGHALGLPHRQDRTNLLASGTSGTALNREEVDRARQVAGRRWKARPVAELSAEAEAAEGPTARRLWTWLSQIPGAGAEAARTRLDALPTEPQVAPAPAADPAR